MNPLIQSKNATILPVLIALTLGCFVLLPAARAVDPPPDGGYAGGNTALGEDALFSLTIGLDNTAIGFNALYHNTTGNGNTANGWSALFNNTTGFTNTASGVYALISNTTGFLNTAIGGFALGSNTTGFENTAIGNSALFGNTNGVLNTANGFQALSSNTTGADNTANGANALQGNTIGYSNTSIGQASLYSNTTGFNNTANGRKALFNNTTGSNNTANGVRALQGNTTGNNNIAQGSRAGSNITRGSNNIDIGNPGFAGDSNTIRIGRVGTQTATFIAGISGVTVAAGVTVVVDTNGQLGTITSSERFKSEIKPMDKASESILALQPVTFRYKNELDRKGVEQFGLVAEEVEKVNPDLVARDDEGKPYTVRYEAVNAMLLNEFLKEHRKVEKQAEINQRQEATIARLEAALKAQAAQIQKVSDQLGAQALAPRVVANN